MKKFFAVILILAMLMSLAACKKAETPAQTPPATEAPEQTQAPEQEQPEEPDGALSMGNNLKNEFVNLVSAGEADLQKIADALLANPSIEFSGASAPMEEGYLAGFDVEIQGFEEGIMFGPAIGSIPFVGYVFAAADESAAQELVSVLAENANPRWNICVEADETVVHSEGNLVFFVMCPKG